MKRLSYLFVLFFAVMAISSGAFAQSWVKNAFVKQLPSGVVISCELTLDTNNTYQSESFSLNRFDNDSFATYPLSIEYYNYSAKGAVQVTAILQYSFDNVNFTNKDTAIAASSSEARTATTLTPTVKAPYYRWNFVGGTNNRADCLAKLYTYAYRKDNE